MILFKTDRLIIKTLEPRDLNSFIGLLADPKIIDPIPQPRYSENQILERFESNLNLAPKDFKVKRCACGIFLKQDPEMIGLCLFLFNDEKDHELGYRFKVKYWGKGYGTEVTKEMLDFYFQALDVEKVTADVAIANVASDKILSKFMAPVREFYNARDNCMDRRYAITKLHWSSRLSTTSKPI